MVTSEKSRGPKEGRADKIIASRKEGRQKGERQTALSREDSDANAREEAGGPYSHQYTNRPDGRTSFVGHLWNVINAIQDTRP